MNDTSWSKDRRIDAAGHAHVACESRKLPTEFVPRGLVKRRGIRNSGMTLHSRIWSDSLSEYLSTPAGVEGKKRKKKGKQEERGLNVGVRWYQMWLETKSPVEWGSGSGEIPCGWRLRKPRGLCMLALKSHVMLVRLDTLNPNLWKYTWHFRRAILTKRYPYS